MISGSTLGRGFQDAGHVLVPLSSRELVNFLNAAKGYFSAEFIRPFLVPPKVLLRRHTESAGLIFRFKVTAVLARKGEFVVIVSARVYRIFFY